MSFHLILEGITEQLLQSYVDVVTRCAPQAQLLFDRFHLQRLAQDAVDTVRREEVRELRGTEEGRASKKTRYGFREPPSLTSMIYLRCSGVVIPPVVHFPARAA